MQDIICDVMQSYVRVTLKLQYGQISVNDCQLSFVLMYQFALV